MRKLLALSMVTCLVLAMFASTMTASPPQRIQICHVTANRELANGIVQVMGMVKTIPRPAWRAHRHHGDVRLAQAAVDGSCCAFSVLPNGDIVPGRVD